MSTKTLRADAPARNSSVELLRIVAMLFIVLSHACYHSGIEVPADKLSLNGLLAQWGTLGNLGVDIFVIISGYFLSAKAVRRRSLSKLLVQVWFYSILLFLICKFGFGKGYSMGGYLQVFLPTVFGEYWFFTAYVVLMLLCPCLNILINGASRSQLLKLLVCMLAIWIVLPTFTGQQMYGSEIPQFLFFYTVGAYFRKYPENIFGKKAVRVLVTAASFCLMLLSTVVLNWLGQRFSVFQNRGIQFYDKNSLLIAGCAIGLFAIAAYAKPFFSKLVNGISACTFGVYLIHDNPVVRRILWKELLPLAKFFDSPLFPLILLGAVAVVFVLCAAIEFVRLKTVAKPMTKLLDLIIGKVLQIASAIFKRMTKAPAETK